MLPVVAVEDTSLGEDTVGTNLGEGTDTHHTEAEGRWGVVAEPDPKVET
jgi:hypothetical protein